MQSSPIGWQTRVDESSNLGRQVGTHRDKGTSGDPPILPTLQPWPVFEYYYPLGHFISSFPPEIFASSSPEQEAGSRSGLRFQAYPDRALRYCTGQSSVTPQLRSARKAWEARWRVCPTSIDMPSLAFALPLPLPASTTRLSNLPAAQSMSTLSSPERPLFCSPFV